MAKSDYLRPSDDQITILYQCSSCKKEYELPQFFSPAPCRCGGNLTECGMSYPADADEWDQERE